ncbi:MAG: PhoX family phosphatase [Pseudomonadota bacterium]
MNRSRNAARRAAPSFSQILLTRRALLAAGAGGAVLAALGGCASKPKGVAPVIGFTPVPVSREDTLRVPPEYETSVLLRWGDPVGIPGAMPEFRMDASNSASEQALQAGMHHDGMHYFPLPRGSRNSAHGLLAINHEYADVRLLHPDGQENWSAEKVAKSQASLGVSVIEVRMEGGRWQVVRPSSYARRITARTPCRVSGPAAGHALLRTAADPEGRTVLGTFGGCAHGWTPWGTFLTCEENFQFMFADRGAIPPERRRFGFSAAGRNYRWHEFDERFDAQRHPNEPNRFGWVVEIDPYDPSWVPVKRTALGRMKHEGAACAVGANGRLAFYMGDDQAFEYVYKFVPARRWSSPERDANRDMLDEGTLYVARFHADGSGEWLPLVHGLGPLTAANGFRDQGEVVVKARFAADLLGATKMDRPEWIVPHPVTGEVYCACTNNAARGHGANEGPNPANRRPNNVMGHIIRWREAGNDPAATRFAWDIFVEAGDPAQPEPHKKGNIRGDIFGSPDGLWIDSMGTLWVQTDMSGSLMLKGDHANFGTNQMLAVDPATGVFRRFLTGPRGCEITGFHTTPDNRTAFVNIQHPGEGWKANPREVSNWPDYHPQGRPRSATVVIRRRDGGVIGT